jgi:hypothetical protein
MSLYKGTNLIAGNPNSANSDLSNITNDATTKIAHNAMPSVTHVDLTLGASGSTYTMPADGYLIYILSPQNNNMWFELQGLLGTGSYAGGNTTYGYHGFMPVKKGEVVTIAYSNCSTSLLRFIYANGSAWEA